MAVAVATMLTNKPNTVLILYPPGAYGTFFEWGLNYFSGQLDDDRLPFTTNGSSHGFVGNSMHQPRGRSLLDQYMAGEQEHQFIRCHGGDLNVVTAQQTVDRYKKSLKKIVYIDPDLPLLVLHNHLTKVPGGAPLFPNFSHLSIWEQRENLSLWLNRYLNFYQYRCDLTDPYVLTVSLKKLISDPEETFKSVFDELDLTFIDRNSTKIFSQWLSLQKFTNRDELCNSIIEATVTNKFLSWPSTSLDIYDEAFVQRGLKVLHNLTLKCYNLNAFPTSTEELWKYLIHE